MKSFHPGKQRGQVFVVIAISLVMLVAVVGLAVESGLGYLIKAKLNSAVDAAAVAGARASSKGLTQGEQRAAAMEAARNFFASNYPDAYLGSSVKLTDINVTFDSPQMGSTTVDVAAQASVPLSFMRVVGLDVLDITASSQTIRKDLDLAFVIDTSGSMGPSGDEVKQQAGIFLDKFNPTTDRLSLIHFSVGAEVDMPIRVGQRRGFDRDGMKAHINAYRFGAQTNSSEGFWQAQAQLNGINAVDRSSLRVIVFFSDGSPNTLASHFNFRAPGGCALAGAITTGDFANGTPGGLEDPARQQQGLTSCNFGYNITAALTATGLPDWYNAHGLGDRDFRIVTNSPRLVENNTSTRQATWVNVNHAAKNVVEAMAAKARSEGIHVFTLGLGALLRGQSEPFAFAGDTGENLLKCMANTEDAPARCKAGSVGHPTGVYCYAATANDLQPCFASLASEILRITR